MKRQLVRSGLRIVCLLLAFTFFQPLTSVSASPREAEGAGEASGALALLRKDLGDTRPYYDAYRGEPGTKEGKGEIKAKPSIERSKDEAAAAIRVQAGPDSIGYHDAFIYTFEVKEEGFYSFSVPYRVADEAMNNVTLSLTLDGSAPFREASTLDVPLFWHDESKHFTLDSYGDESLPNQLRSAGERTWYPYDNTYKTDRPLEFHLTPGRHTLRLENITADPLYFGELTFAPLKPGRNYEAYRAEAEKALPDAMPASPDTLLNIDAISYTEKNSSFIRMASLRNPDVSPYDPVDRKINIIDGDGWKKAGQQIDYAFEVPADGDYLLSFHYSSKKEDFSVFRAISIDGQVPFDGFQNFAFPFTDGRWTNFTAAGPDGTYKLRLAKGKHTLSLTAVQGLVSPSLNRLQLLIDHINHFALEIRKITGKDVDRHRTWRLTQYLPETARYLGAYSEILDDVLRDLSRYAPNGDRSSTLSFLLKAKAKLANMSEDPDELPLYFQDLYSGTGSVTQLLGDTIDRLNNEGLSLDAIYIHGEGAKLPAPRAGFLARVAGDTENFISTFTQDKYLIRPDEDAVNVWVSRPITYVDIMQKQVDASFTKKTGIRVKLSVMPDANRLILSNAAGKAPDVALGLPSHTPYDIAIRGAAYPLSDFEDFWKVAKQSTPGAFIPYIFSDKVYALPETLDFQAMVYRKDIFRTLGLKPPSTWDDIIDILPVLQRYGMNFYSSVAGGVATKWFYQTTPMIYQHQGRLFENGGFYTSIDEPNAVKGITALTDLFTTYSVPIQVPNFYNSFRYGQLPIGMVDFNTYLQIQNAAPELKGQWALIDYPGTKGKDGKIRRWFVTNGTGAVLMDKGHKPTKAWEFLKWWTSTETQTDYANLLSSTYGPEYIWLSGNLKAAANAPIPAQDKEVILRQIPWLRDVPRTPGQYMLERGLSDIWSKVVQNGMVPRVAIDQQKIIINREIRRKMHEFGFIDKEGKILRPYTVRDIEWVKAQMDRAGN